MASSSRARLLRTAALVSAAGAFVFASPMLAHVFEMRTPIDIDSPLKPEAVRRGAFNNSGSRDIGPDPQWEKGTFRKSAGQPRTAPEAES